MDNSSRPLRKKIRMEEYDYSQNGSYFVTICTAEKKHIFGEIIGNEMKRSSLGEIAWQEIGNMMIHRSDAFVDCAIVMPNHVHLLITLKKVKESENYNINKFAAPISGSLAMIVGAYKAAVSRKSGITGLWQRGYYDHVIRSQDDYNRIYDYILTNPITWNKDKYFEER